MSAQEKTLTTAIHEALILCIFETQGVVKNGDLVDIKSALAEDSADLHDVIQTFLASYDIESGGFLHLNDRTVHITGNLNGEATIDAFDNEGQKLLELVKTITNNYTEVLDRYANAVRTGNRINTKPKDNQALKLNDRLWNIKEKGEAVIFFPGPFAFQLSPVNPKYLRATNESRERVFTIHKCLFTGIRPSGRIMDALESEHIKINWVITLEGNDEISEMSTFLTLRDAQQLIIAKTKIDAHVSRSGKSQARCIDSFVASNPDGSKIISKQ